MATPLRPGSGDIAWAQEAVDAVAEGRDGIKVLLLGVTPELSTLRFPADAALLAVDSSQEMIRNLWTPPGQVASLAVRARWETLPVRAGSVDLVLADASFCALPDQPRIRQVLGTVASAMKAGARISTRTFVSPEIPERLADIEDQISAGRAGTIHGTKWRVAMALPGAAEHGVPLVEVWRVFRRLGGCARLAERNGWPEAAVETVEAYRQSVTRLCFPTLRQTRELFAAHFTEDSCRFPDYELGERCPTLLWTRRAYDP